MALVKNPVQRAHAAKTPLQARRLREELEVELALNDSLPPGWETEADHAIDILNERFGRAELDKIDPAGRGAGGWSPSYSPAASEAASGGATDASRGSSAPPEIKPAPVRRRPSSPGGARGRSRGRRGDGGLFSSRAAEQTGIPGATRSAGQIALRTFGLMIGLSLTLLLLRNASRSAPNRSAVELFAGSVSSAVQTVVRADVDPLRSRHARSSRTLDGGLSLGQAAPPRLGPSLPRRGAHPRQPATP